MEAKRPRVTGLGKVHHQAVLRASRMHEAKPTNRHPLWPNRPIPVTAVTHAGRSEKPHLVAGDPCVAVDETRVGGEKQKRFWTLTYPQISYGGYGAKREPTLRRIPDEVAQAAIEQALADEESQKKSGKK